MLECRFQQFSRLRPYLMLFGYSGDAQSDWENAEKIYRSPLRRFFFYWHQPLINLEKKAWEPLLLWLNNQALLRFVRTVGNVSIIAILMYVGSEKQRMNVSTVNK